MSSPYLGEIRMFGGTFAPSGWQTCDGQLIPISDNTALFNLIGTTYGGDGRTTFALPDLRGRVPVNQGAGPGLSPRVIGQPFGSEAVTLTATQAAHSHQLLASTNTAAAPAAGPSNNVLAQIASPDMLYSTSTTQTVSLLPASVTQSGGSQSHPNMMPSLCVTFIICMAGIYPSQSS